MSLKWPDKDPDDTLDYSVDWERFLGTDTISSVTWTINDSSGTEVSFSGTVNGLTNVSVSNTDTVATIFMSGGTANTTYTVFCQIVSVSGLVAKRTITLKVRQR